MIAKIKKIFLSKYMILFIITICVFAPYISSNFVKGNDYICHLANLYAMDDNISLSDGILFPSKIRPIIFNNLGYDITFEDDNGTTEKLEYYENDNGLIEIEVNKSGTITIEYTGTTLNKIADIISVLIIILFVVFCIIIPCITKNNVKLLDKETKNKCR